MASYDKKHLNEDEKLLVLDLSDNASSSVPIESSILLAIENCENERVVDILKNFPQKDQNIVNKALYKSVLTENLYVVRALIRDGADVVLTSEGKTCLHVAAEKGCSEIVRHLIQNRKHCVNKLDKEGNTALHLCQESREAYVMSEDLLSVQADTSIRNVSGETALVKALKKYNLRCVTLLDLDGNTARSEAFNLGMVNLLKILDTNNSLYNSEDETALMRAIACRDLDLVKFLLSKDKHVVNETNRNGDTCLFLFLKNKEGERNNDCVKYDKCCDWFTDVEIQIISLLLEYGAYSLKNNKLTSIVVSVVKIGDKKILDIVLNKKIKALQCGHFCKAVEIASKNGRCDLIDSLFSEGNIFGDKLSGSWSKIVLSALEKDREDCCLKLMQFTQLSDSVWNTAMSLSVHRGFTSVFKMLKNLYPNFFSKLVRVKGIELLHKACVADSYEIAKIFLEVGVPASPHSNSARYQPMNVVRSASMAELLFKHGASIHTTRTLFKSTAIQEAALSNNCDVARVLINHGAKVDVNLLTQVLSKPKCRGEMRKLMIDTCDDPNQPDRYGRFALCYAADQADECAVELLLARGADANRFISTNTDIKDCNLTVNNPPLICAASSRSNKSLSLLLSHGADVNIKNEKNQTALMFAVDQLVDEDKCKDTVQILLDNGADVNCKDSEGNTALIVAVKCCFRKAAFILLENGADIKVMNDEGESALTIAALKGKKCMSILDIVIKFGANVNTCHKDLPILYWTIISKEMDVSNHLIEAGADVNFKINNYSLLSYLLKFDTLLLIFDISSRLEVVSVIFTLLKHDAQISTNESLSAVHLCIKHRRLKLLKSLVHDSCFSPSLLTDFSHSSFNFPDSLQIQRICSPLFVALYFNQHVIAENMLNLFYLTPSDLTILPYTPWFKDQMELKNLDFLKQMSQAPPTLFTFALVKISSWISCTSPGRRERVASLPLPDSLKNILTFSSKLHIDDQVNDSLTKLQVFLSCSVLRLP